MSLKFSDLLLAELSRETERSKHALEMVPAGKRSWKPHEKSMELGYLCDIIATLPSWLVMIVNQKDLDVAPAGGSRQDRPHPEESAAFVAELAKAAAQAQTAIAAASDQHLQEPWNLLAGGKIVQTMPRHEMLRDTMNHWAHHRGQLTVYLRLLGAKVPAVYGPSADDKHFG